MKRFVFSLWYGMKVAIKINFLFACYIGLVVFVAAYAVPQAIQIGTFSIWMFVGAAIIITALWPFLSFAKFNDWCEAAQKDYEFRII